MKSRIAIDEEQVARFAVFFKAAKEVKPFTFCADGLFPPVGAVGALDLFFFGTAHQFGFWHAAQGRYARPMIATLDGRPLKGSDYLFACQMRAWRKDPLVFAPSRLAQWGEEDFNALFADDAGRNPLPMWPVNWDLIRGYVGWFASREVTPEELVREANGAARPLARFLECAGEVPGYREDPLQKKLQLLAVILENRPERFLRVTDPESYRPIIDYHLQRSALRTGLVEIRDVALRAKLADRREVSAEEENAVRRGTFEAVRRVVAESGSSVAAVDYFFFQNRTRCPEMSEPQCSTCPVRDICRRRKDLFQPVYRTDAY